MAEQFQLYSVAAYDPDSGEIHVKKDSITARGTEGARLKLAKMLKDTVDLDKVRLVVTPLG